MARSKKKRSKPPRLHHYLPQFELSYFADRSGKLWIYDRKREEYRQQTPRSIAAIKDYYTYRDRRGKKRAEIEELLSRIEAAVAPIITKLHGGEKRLTIQEKYNLSNFFSLRWARTPTFQLKTEALGEAIAKTMMQVTASHDKAFEAMVDKVERKRGVKIDNREELRKFITEERYNIKFDRETSLQIMLKALDDIAPIIFQMKWYICRPPKRGALITSDNPFFVWQVKKPRGWMSGGGLLSPGSESIIPLTPKLCFVLKPDENVELFAGLTSEGVKSINSRIALMSRRFIFSHSEALLRRTVKRTRLAEIEPFPIGVEVASGFSKKIRRYQRKD